MCSSDLLLKYAEVTGERGNIKVSDKICKLIMSVCDEETNIHYKTRALEIYTGLHGIDAMKLLQAAASHPDKKYRNAAMRISLDIPNGAAISRWIAYYPKASPESRPELITLFGISGDASSLPLVTEALSDADPHVRYEAANAISRIGGEKAIPSLITYLMKYGDESDQKAAKSALVTLDRKSVV